MLAVFLGGLNISLLVIALPTIRSAFDLSPGGQHWLISGYLFTFGLVLVPAGRYGDLRGRRNVFVAGITLFVVANTAAGFAPAGLWLIVARLAQGVGVGMALPQVFGTVQRMFAARERGRPLGRLAAAVSASRLAGPVLGGVLVVGGGLVIAPNQTLALSHVRPAECGSAGGMLQTGQRFGGGVGVAAVGTALFANLENTGDWLLASAFPWRSSSGSSSPRWSPP